MQKETAFQKLEELLLPNPLENQDVIIALMVTHQISIPQILARETSRTPRPRRKIFKSICELTGYSFDDLPINAYQKDRIKQKYPDICKGCSDRLRTWSHKFQTAQQELIQTKQKKAALMSS